MKSKLLKPKTAMRRWLLSVMAAVLAGAVLGIGAMPVQAANTMSYNDYRSKIDADAQKYCTGVTGADHTSCINSYTSGASAAYFSSTSSVHQQIQAACSPPIVIYPSSSTQQSNCGAFATGATIGQKILGSSAGAGASQGSGQPSNQGGNQKQSQKGQSAKQPQAPPISQCNGLTGKTNGQSNVQLCKDAYTKCNQPSYSAAEKAACKTKVINTMKKSQQQAVKGGGKGGGGKGGKPQVTPTDCSNNNGCDLIGKYVDPTINLLSALFGLVAAGSLIIGGIQYTASEGDPQKASKAKTRMVNTVFAILAYAVLYGFFQFLVPGGVFNR